MRITGRNGLARDTPDALLHKLRAAVVGEAHTDNDLTLRQMRRGANPSFIQ
jgi:hypothetical protein